MGQASASTKLDRYAALVRARKACRLCAPELTNPAEFRDGRFDSEHIGPWSGWQGNLNAELLIVGQDWAGTRYFEDNEGWEDPRNPTNTTLVKLLEGIGISIPLPGSSNDAPVVFLTNAVLCLKQGGLQDKVRAHWFTNCQPHLRGLIELVRARVVVGLGEWAFGSILRAFGLKPDPLRRAVEDREGTLLPCGSRAFAVYHCGARVLNTHRPLKRQREDWRRIGEALGRR